MADMFMAARRATRWIDCHNGRSEAEITLRLLKLAEESGEVSAAWIGYTGQNPRKGVTHTVQDVARELADVVMTALVALESLGVDAEDAMADCAAKVLAQLDQS